jgi:hypothetical protein
MVDRGTLIATLTKAQVERLLADYDADPIGALTTALRKVLRMPDAPWAELLAAAPINASRRQLLLSGDQASLDRLAAELNERRSLEGPA